MDEFVGIGHGITPEGTYDPGAVGQGSFVEHEKAGEVVEAIAQALKRSKVSCHVERDSGAGHDPNWVRSAQKANSLGVKLALEVHLNAGGGTGCEVLYLSSSGQRFAQPCSGYLAKPLRLPNRGAKRRTDLGFLNSTNMTACLPEICFVDSATDRARFSATKAGEALAQAICEWLGVSYVGPATGRSKIRYTVGEGQPVSLDDALKELRARAGDARPQVRDEGASRSIEFSVVPEE